MREHVDQNVHQNAEAFFFDDFLTDDFDLDELERFLKKAKDDKSPGPDGIPMEFFKWTKGRTQERNPGNN